MKDMKVINPATAREMAKGAVMDVEKIANIRI